jgi:membrane peptidoglycan carboxypeptidase
MKFVKKHKEKIVGLTKAFIAAVVLLSGALVAWGATLTIPSLASFDERKIFQSTKIFDRTGEIVLFDFNRDVRRTVITLEDMSPNVINATIAIEDSQFYSHSGVRPLSFFRAAFINLRDGQFSQGGSTITQQVVKNSLLTPDKKVSRKVKEWILAIRLENELDKDTILEIYLNEIPYGGTIYGIEEAARYFFGKPASELGVVESAYLAALPQAPTFFSPHGNNREALEDRKNKVLREMLRHNFINQEEYDEALEETVSFLSRDDRGIRAPHFVFFIREQLEEMYGTRLVEEGGLRVITTIDYELQREGERIVREYALRNEQQFNAENAALVAIDPRTGQIITMVGSRGWSDERIDGKYNVATSPRQPGSSFKPIVYAAALKEGSLLKQSCLTYELNSLLLVALQTLIKNFLVTAQTTTTTHFEDQ